MPFAADFDRLRATFFVPELLAAFFVDFAAAFFVRFGALAFSVVAFSADAAAVVEAAFAFADFL
ncbi:MAG: hypothetical protein KC485_07640, partial [Gemmatimonadetes bacterium]|nr:hypothetical protein [Gemmatimonadota bacterium]